MSRWLAFLPLVAILALGALFGLYALHRNPQVQPQALVGKTMPDLTLPSLEDGAPVRLRDAAAQGPMLVNFFASWCAPCEVEQPVLMQLKARKVRMIGIAYKDAPPKTQGFLSRLGDPFSQRLVDRDGRAGIEFGVTGVPETYLIGKDGQVLAKHTGPLSPEDAARLADQAR
jgi:cytochrome c biogenesis protein CcmG/thiol:disulfide interchange protein DsbE